MAVGNISLSASARANLAALQNTAQLLQQTLQEEMAADKKLTQVAETEVNERAAALHPVG